MAGPTFLDALAELAKGLGGSDRRRVHGGEAGSRSVGHAFGRSGSGTADRGSPYPIRPKRSCCSTGKAKASSK